MKIKFLVTLGYCAAVSMAFAGPKKGKDSIRLPENAPAVVVTAPAPKTSPATPINPGNGNGRFTIAPPHGGNPPGLNGQPGRKSPPPFVDYSKPRNF